MQAAEMLVVGVQILAFDYATTVIRKLGLTASTLAGTMAVGAVAAGAALAATAVASIEAAKSFDQGLAKISALTKTSRDELTYYRQELLKLAPALDMDPTALTKGLYYIISAGHTGADALTILRYSAMAAAAGLTEFDRVAPAVTSAMNAYGYHANEAGKVTDILMTAVTRGKMEWQAFSTSFAFTAVTFKAANMQLQEAASAVSRLSQVTGPHTIRRVQMELDNLVRQIGIDVVEVGKRAEKLGLPFDTARFAAMSFIDKLKYLSQISGGIGNMTVQNNKYFEEWASHDEAWQKTTEGIQTLAMATAQANHEFKFLVGGAAAFIPAAILLSDKGAMYSDILKDMTGNGEKTAAAFDRMRESAAQQQRMMMIAMKSLAVTIGVELLPLFGALVTGVRNLFIGITTWLNTGNNMEQFKAALLGIALVVTTILIPAFIGMAVAWLAGPGGGIMLSMLAIIAVGAALGIGIREIVKHFGGWDAIMKRLQPTIDNVKQAIEEAKKKIGDLWTALQPLFHLAWDQLVQAWKQIQAAFADPAVQEALGHLKDALPYIAVALGIIIGLPIAAAIAVVVASIVAFAFAVRIVATVAGAVIHVLAWLINAITHIPDALGAVGAAIGSFFGGILGAIGSFAGSVLGAIGSFFGGIFGAIGSFVGNALGAIGNFIETVIDIVVGIGVVLYNSSPIFRRMVDNVVGVFRFITQTVPALIGALGVAIQAKWHQIQAGAAAAWSLFQRYIIKPVGDALGWVGDRLGELVAFLGGVWAGIVSAAQAAWAAFVGAITGAVGNVAKGVDIVTKPIRDAIGGLITGAIDWGKNLIENFVKGIQNSLGKVGDVLGNLRDIGKHFLQGHSPPAGWPEQGQYGGTLIRNFNTGILSALPSLSTTLAKVVGATNAALMGGGGGARGSIGVNASGAGRAIGGNLPVLGSVGGGGGGGRSLIIHANFPNVKDKAEIKAAFAEMGREQYAKTRRTGNYSSQFNRY
jgi:TP901 family phage tail tape measure protein